MSVLPVRVACLLFAVTSLAGPAAAVASPEMVGAEAAAVTAAVPAADMTLTTPALVVVTYVHNPLGELLARAERAGVVVPAPVAVPKEPLWTWRDEGARSATDLLPLLPDDGLAVPGFTKGTLAAMTASALLAPVDRAVTVDRESSTKEAWNALLFVPDEFDAVTEMAVMDAATAALAFVPSDALAPTPRLPVAAVAPAVAEPAPDASRDAHAAAVTHDTPTASAALLARAAFAAAALVPVGVALWFLYHRLAGRSVLDHPKRRAMYDAVVAHPGLGPQEAAAAAGVAYATADYHLKRLAREQLIVITNRGGRVRCYKNGGALTPEARAVVPIIESAECMRVVAALRAEPGTHRAALARALGLTPSTIAWHLRALDRAGFLVREKAGRATRLHVRAAAFDAAAATVAAERAASAPVATAAPAAAHAATA